MIAFLEGTAERPNHVVHTPPRSPPRAAIEGRVLSAEETDENTDSEVVEAEIMDNAEPGDDTPPRIAEMIKAGVFDRMAGE